MIVYYSIFLLSLIYLLSISLNSKNKFLFSFGFAYFLYGLGLLLIKFDINYFGKGFITVKFSGFHYGLFLIMNIILIITILVDGKISLKQGISISERILRQVSILFLLIGSLAMLNELQAYGFEDFFFAKKMDRFAGLYNIPPNLYFLSINYHLFLLAGLYGLASKINCQRVKNVLYLCMAFISIVGFIQGYRYYVAILFVLVLLRYIRSTKDVLMAMAFIGSALLLADFIRILSDYIRYYNTLPDTNLYRFFMHSGFGIIPIEIKAISANIYLGFQMFDNLRPDMLSYLVKFIPFSEQFYDFSSMNFFYGEIGRFLNAPPGAGTAFSFILENYTSYFAPMMFLIVITVLYRFHTSPILLIVWIYLSLNLVRNGLIVSITEFKMVMIFYVSFAVGSLILDKVRFTEKLKGLFKLRMIK